MIYGLSNTGFSLEQRNKKSSNLVIMEYFGNAVIWEAIQGFLEKILNSELWFKEFELHSFIFFRI